jgi:hypothetical protein
MTEQIQTKPHARAPSHAAASANVRTFAPWLVGGGIALAFAIPLAGIALACIGLALWPAATATDPVVAQALTEAEQGGGGGRLALAVLMIVGFGVLALAVLGAAVEGGAITP